MPGHENEKGEQPIVKWARPVDLWSPFCQIVVFCYGRYLIGGSPSFRGCPHRTDWDRLLVFLLSPLSQIVLFATQLRSSTSLFCFKPWRSCFKFVIVNKTQYTDNSLAAFETAAVSHLRTKRVKEGFELIWNHPPIPAGVDWNEKTQNKKLTKLNKYVKIGASSSRRPHLLLSPRLFLTALQ